MTVKHEIRLWDSQYLEIACHDSNYRGWIVEDAVAHAIQETEKAMARNFENGKWPLPRPIITRGHDDDA